MCDCEATTTRGCHLGYTDTLRKQAGYRHSECYQVVLSCDGVYFCSLHRHKCFTGKYTTRKICTKLHPGHK